MQNKLLRMVENGDITHQEIRFLREHMLDAAGAAFLKSRLDLETLGKKARRKKIDFASLLERGRKHGIIEGPEGKTQVNLQEAPLIIALARLAQLNPRDIKHPNQTELAFPKRKNSQQRDLFE